MSWTEVGVPGLFKIFYMAGLFIVVWPFCLFGQRRPVELQQVAPEAEVALQDGELVAQMS